MPYTPTAWSSGVTPASAPNMNNLEAGVVQAVTKNGDTAMTAALPVTQTLSGSNKVFADFTATDGKHYQLIIRTDGKFVIYNVTDTLPVFECGPTGVISSNGYPVPIIAGGKTISIQSSAPGGPAVNDVWIDTSISL